MKTLLAIINKPEDSKSFLKYAALLANDLKLRVHVFYAQSPVTYPMGAPDSYMMTAAQIEQSVRSTVKDARKTIVQTMNELTKETSLNVFSEITTDIAFTTSEVNRMVNDGKVDMVMVANKENEDFLLAKDELDMDLIKSVDCPVLVVPDDAQYSTMSEIIYATDYNKEDIYTLKRLLDIAGHNEPNITALHINKSDDFEQRVLREGFLTTIRKKINYNRINVKSLVEKQDSDMVNLLTEYAKLVKADLIVVLKENRHFLDRIFRNSSSKKIIEHTELPVFVFHEKGVYSEE